MGKNKKTGGKVSRGHSTMIDAVIPIVKAAEKCPEISKVFLGIMKQIGKGPPKIKFRPINGGLLAIIRGSVCLQEVYFYTSNPRKTEKLLTRVFYE